MPSLEVSHPYTRLVVPFSSFSKISIVRNQALYLKCINVTAIVSSSEIILSCGLAKLEDWLGIKWYYRSFVVNAIVLYMLYMCMHQGSMPSFTLI